MKRWIVTADTIGNQIVELALFPDQVDLFTEFVAVIRE